MKIFRISRNHTAKFSGDLFQYVHFLMKWYNFSTVERTDFSLRVVDLTEIICFMILGSNLESLSSKRQLDKHRKIFEDHSNHSLNDFNHALLVALSNIFLLFLFQNLKNQIMTTNLWVEQVSYIFKSFFIIHLFA